MAYIVKGFIDFGDNDFHNSIEIKCASFDDVKELMLRVSLEAYDRVTILPEDYKEI